MDRVSEYLQHACRGLPVTPKERRRIEEELKDHIRQHQERFAAEGHSPEQCVELALQQLGSPDIVQQTLAQAHHSGIGRRFLKPYLMAGICLALLCLVFDIGILLLLSAFVILPYPGVLASPLIAYVLLGFCAVALLAVVANVCWLVRCAWRGGHRWERLAFALLPVVCFVVNGVVFQLVVNRAGETSAEILTGWFIAIASVVGIVSYAVVEAFLAYRRWREPALPPWHQA